MYKRGNIFSDLEIRATWDTWRYITGGPYTPLLWAIETFTKSQKYAKKEAVLAVLLFAAFDNP